jgi:hypothetical protein
MSPTYIVRRGVLLAVPEDYAEMAEHRALVDRLSTNSYLEAVAVLETVPLTNWLAADLLTGAAWARRYLNTTAKLWMQDKKLAGRGTRAMMRVLSGFEAKIGRQRSGPLAPEIAAKAATVLADWRALVDAEWAGDRAGLASTLAEKASALFTLSATHRRALRALVRRQRLKKADVVLTLSSWETGIPLRRLRSAQPVADLVYG